MYIHTYIHTYIHKYVNHIINAPCCHATIFFLSHATIIQPGGPYQNSLVKLIEKLEKTIGAF